MLFLYKNERERSHSVLLETIKMIHLLWFLSCTVHGVIERDSMILVIIALII